MTFIIGGLIILFWQECIMILFTGNQFIILIEIEILIFLMILSIISISWQIDDLIGNFIGLLMIPIAGCESALALILLIIYYPSRGTILLEQANKSY